ncbi:hypothetical protein [Tenuibacillus multivorans]|uniref:Uncharacterized protein n=1 Tax=Tenuibacillus multivorans TaxID=237069 RepID=A0A1H0G0T8_9BACI|nr:hypothetical protein [Tenuibacillus multivorans]GEL78130.1 hypothetical protein TMU01_23650 [Tenuibacillus multivorans]SDO00462.1 hypothetical protein SAMN05216498_0426 [Tenuibacillus multivorans]
MRNKKLEVLFWSIAFPGFGQIINHQLIKGILLIILEVIVNLYSNFNQAILYSFIGEIDKAIHTVDYQWLMFYPCIYFFGIWDAYRNAEGESSPYEFLPFVFSAFFVTVGLIYSYRVELFGYILGPIWLPILSVIPGVVVGLIIKKILRSIN